MATYQKVSLSVRSLSKDYMDGLVQLTLDLLTKEKVNLDFDARLQPAIDRLVALHEAFKTKQVKGDDKGPSLTDLDRQRDMDMTDFLLYIRSQLRHRQDKRRQAAGELYALVKPVSAMKNQSQAEQSLGLRHLLKQLEDKEGRAKVTLIGALDYVTNLKDSQAKFEEAYLQKTKERQQAQFKSAEQSRVALLTHYRELYGYLLALEYFDQDGPHRPVLAVFNAARLTYQDKVKRKANQSKKKAKEQTEDDSQVQESAED